MHRIICETYRENVIIIRMCANWFNRFKNGNFDIRHKKFRMPCKYKRERIAERWEKCVENNGKYFD